MHPIVQVDITSLNTDPLPTSLVATLTFNGVADNAVTFQTTGHAAGDTFLLAVQHATQITTSGYYSWNMAVTVNYAGGPTNLNLSGSMAIVVRDTSSDALGRGWSLQGLDRVYTNANGALLVYGGTGGGRYFTGTSGPYTNPANDFGAFV